MNIPPLGSSSYETSGRLGPAVNAEKLNQVSSASQQKDDPELRKAFQDFVGQTFYSQMLSAMRKTVGKPAYLYGGRAEEVFQGQLDQVLSEKLSDATADTFSGPMYELFTAQRSR